MTVVALPEVEALFEVLDSLCAQGGPEPHAYQALNEHIARHLHHRDRRTLESLGRSTDEGAEVSIGMEPAGVNLFLHVRRLV